MSEFYSCKICKVTSKKTHPKDNICSDCAKLFGGKQFTLESYGCDSEKEKLHQPDEVAVTQGKAPPSKAQEPSAAKRSLKRVPNTSFQRKEKFSLLCKCRKKKMMNGGKNEKA